MGGPPHPPLVTRVWPWRWGRQRKAQGGRDNPSVPCFCASCTFSLGGHQSLGSSNIAKKRPQTWPQRYTLLCKELLSNLCAWAGRFRQTLGGFGSQPGPISSCLRRRSDVLHSGTRPNLAFTIGQFLLSSRRFGEARIGARGFLKQAARRSNLRATLRPSPHNSPKGSFAEQFAQG